jgi:hypothetical protein
MIFGRCAVRHSRIRKAVEVARRNSTLELVIKTAMPKGTTIPKGRLTWPREAKPRSEERILVFAEGRQADEAKRAGAHIVGGLELVDDVSSFSKTVVFTSYFFPGHQWASQPDHNPLCAESPSFDYTKTRPSARPKRTYALGETRDRNRGHCWLYSTVAWFRGVER